MRMQSNSKIIGFCTETPKQVFKQLFKKFYVTNYSRRELYSSSCFDENTPMKGLIINPYPRLLGISGTLKEIIDSEKIDYLKRDKKPSKKEIETIRRYIEKGDEFHEEGLKILEDLELRRNPKGERSKKILEEREITKEIIELIS